MSINYGLLFIYVFLVLSNIYYGFGKYNGKLIISRKYLIIKTEDILSFLLLSYLIFLAVHDKDNPDIQSYRYAYEGKSIYVRDTEIGFELLTNISKRNGFDFYQFRFGVYIFCGISIWYFLNKIQINKNIVLSLYAFFPFVYDAIQMRNFLAFSIILCVFPSLLKGTRRGILIYIVGTILSSLIHYMEILYLILILINFRREIAVKNRQIILKCFLQFRL